MKRILKIVITAINIIIFVFLSSCLISKNRNYPWYFSFLNITGEGFSGQTVCLIDSGYCDGFNEENIIDKYNVFDDSDEVWDENGHGSAMLSLLIGYESKKIKIYGINPTCKVVIIKAVDKYGHCSVDNMEEAIIYASNYKHSIISISLGTYKDDIKIKNAINVAKMNSCEIVAAAGDDNKNTIMYPAMYEDVNAITCQTKTGEKYILGNSNEKTFFCPGVNVDILNFNKYETLNVKKETGSSISTILFTGVLSLFDLSKETINYQYLTECKKSKVFFDKEMIIVR